MTALVSAYPVEILEGKKNIECRQTGVNKGDIVKNIIQGNATSEFDFILCCGDDRTDEDVFLCGVMRVDVCGVKGTGF